LPKVKSGATISYNSASGTITGSGTLWLTDPDASLRAAHGDVIYSQSLATNPDGSQNFDGSNEYYIVAVNSDTSLRVLSNGSWGNFSGTTFQLYHAWQSGSCGFKWLKNHWLGGVAQPSLYPPTGGGSATLEQEGANPIPTEGGNNGYTQYSAYVAFGLAAADDDPRAITLLEQAESMYWDWFLPLSIGYTTGYQRSGAAYSYQRTLTDSPMTATWLLNSVNGFPDLGVTGPWITRPPMLKIYEALPFSFNGEMWSARWGAETSTNFVNWFEYYWQQDSVFRLAPNSNEAQYFRNWITVNGPTYPVTASWAPVVFPVAGDPAIGSLDYTQLPTQYLFRTTSQATCSTLGISCPSNWTGDGFISRSGWKSQNDTHVMFMARTFLNDHDVPQPGVLKIFKTGYLIDDGNSPPGGAAWITCWSSADTSITTSASTRPRERIPAFRLSTAGRAWILTATHNPAMPMPRRTWRALIPSRSTAPRSIPSTSRSRAPRRSSRNTMTSTSAARRLPFAARSITRKTARRP
jgi:hypothetical protein